jgi:peptidyl-tRNA hydrolase
MFKHELFTKETNTKFNEHENAILEVSQQLQSQTDVEPLSTDIGETEIDLESSVVLSDDPDAEKILSAELKNMIKQELSGEMESA